MSADFYEFFSPVKIIAGHKALEHLPHELASLGVRRPLLAADGVLAELGLTDIVVDALRAGGIELAGLFTDVPPDAPVAAVHAMAQAYREQGADGLIALGGGSVIDAAKAANILASLGGDDVLAYLGADTLTQALGPFFVLPTTAGTGSEVTSVAVMHDAASGNKLPIQSRFILPDAAVLDPRLTLGLPPQVTAATAMDALTHCIEAYTCLGKNPLSDAYATAGITTISQSLLAVLESPDDADLRLSLSQAATQAGIAFSNSMVGLVHAISHTLGAHCHLPHGIANSIMLPHVLAYNRPLSGDVIGELLLYCRGAETYAATPADERALAVIESIHSLKEALHQATGLPRSLSESGLVERSQLQAIAELAVFEPSLTFNPTEAKAEDILHILEAAW